MHEKISDQILDQTDIQLFQDISTSVHASEDFERMLSTILLKIKEALKVDGASIALHEPNKKEFYFIRTVEMEKYGKHEGFEKMRFPDHVGTASWVLKHNQFAIINDADKDDRVLHLDGYSGNYHIHSLICVPLRTQRGPIGVLYAVNKLNDIFFLKDALLLEILSVTVAMAIENRRLVKRLEEHASNLEEENKRLKSEVQKRYEKFGIIGNSAVMRNVFGFMEKIIDRAVTVCIQGETGTGKELIAKTIHYGGPLKDGPFVSENCGALTETLLESELFGHVKGAFTGAVSEKKGLFEMADGGTILLDEIGEMSPNMQTKMLRVLQEGEFRPVGGSKFKKAKVRVIACTNRNLEEEVSQGRFRKDLYYRINVFPIFLPPLRDRKEDIPLLADHFITLFSDKHNHPKPYLKSEALDLMTAYSWPGNVREVQNEIERALTLLKAGEDINVSHLSPKLKTSSTTFLSSQEPTMLLPDVVNRIEKQMIDDVLKSTKMNRSRAAKMLGISRQGLIKKIKRYNISA